MPKNNTTGTETPAPARTFVVRNPMVDNRYLADPGNYCKAFSFKEAHRFSTLEEARRRASFDSDREIFEVTYGLRWVSNLTTCSYSGGEDGYWFTRDRRKAARFATPELARASTDPRAMYGADGPDDKVGWKVVRFLKKVAR